MNQPVLYAVHHVRERTAASFLMRSRRRVMGSIWPPYTRLYEGWSEGTTGRDGFADFAAASTGRLGQRRRGVRRCR